MVPLERLCPRETGRDWPVFGAGSLTLAIPLPSSGMGRSPDTLALLVSQPYPGCQEGGSRKGGCSGQGGCPWVARAELEAPRGASSSQTPAVVLALRMEPGPARQGFAHKQRGALAPCDRLTPVAPRGSSPDLGLARGWRAGKESGVRKAGAHPCPSPSSVVSTPVRAGLWELRAQELPYRAPNTTARGTKPRLLI